MKIVKVEISNIKGIAKFSQEVGTFNDIFGDNETGKTSFQDALEWAMRPKNTHNPRMLRNGTAKGAVRITFDDGNVLTSTVTAKESTQDFTGQKKAGSYLQSIFDVFALNPASMMVAKKEEQVKVMLNILPINMNWEGFENIVGCKVARTNEPIATVEYWETKIFEDRAKLNTLAEDRERTVDEESRDFPLEYPESPEELIVSLEEQKKEFEQERDAKKHSLTTDSTKKKNDLIAKRDSAIAKANEAYTKSIATLTNDYNTETSKIQVEFDEQITPVISRLGETRELLRNFDSIQGRRDRIAVKRKEAEEMRSESKEYTEQLKAIKAFRPTMFTNFPIPGVSLVGSEIYLLNPQGSPVPLSECADSQQKKFWLDLAKIATMDKEFPIVRMDKLEALTESRFKIFREEAIKSGVQHFVSRAIEGAPFTVNSYN